MNAFHQQVKAARVWWDGRTAREHMMLGALVVMAGLMAGWFLILSPLLAWNEGAPERLERAVHTRALTVAAVGLEPQAGASRPLIEIERLARATAATAGIQAQVRVEETGVAFAVESAETAALFGWIAALERAGLRIADLSVLENADATLQAQGALAP